MREGAEIIVRSCAGVQPGHQVVVVADEGLLAIAGAVSIAAMDAGGLTTVIVPPERSIDDEEPTPPVAAAMRESDVIFMPVARALDHTRATHDAIRAGARVVSMTAFTERMMREGGLFTDFRSRRPVCHALAEGLTAADTVRVRTVRGTDLVFSVRGRHGNAHSCLLDGPGFTAVPNIEANIAPVEGTTQGTLVVDGSIPYYGIGVLTEPVTLEILDGSVGPIRGGDQAIFLEDLLARQDDAAVYNIAQFAMGLNPDCTELTGEMLNDEGVDGTIHIGVGTSANRGGTVRARTHFDAIVREPSVWLDGDQILDSGRLVV